MDIIQVVKGDTGPQLKATVTRSDTGAAFVGSGTIALRIRKKGTTTVESTVALDSTLSDLSQGSLVFPLENFLDTGIFTVSALAGGNLTITAHGLPNSKTGASFKWNSTGTDPSNVTSGSSYFIRVVDANTISLHPTQSDASNNTNALSLSGGTGTFTIADPTKNPNIAEGFYEAEIEFTLADGKVMSVFELIDIKVRNDFGS